MKKQIIMFALLLASALTAMAQGVSQQEINAFVQKLDCNQITKAEATAMLQRVKASKGSTDEFSELLGEGGVSEETFWFNIDGFFRAYFTGDVESETLKTYRVSAYNQTTGQSKLYLVQANQSGKVAFCSPNGVAMPVAESEAALIKQSLSTLYIIQDLCAGVNNKYAKSAYIKARLGADKVREALANNAGGDVYDVMPMPKAGALHASIHSQAVAAAKKHYANIVDVIITESEWQYHRNALGVILDRYTAAQLIAVTDGENYGIKAFFKQTREGNGYGTLFLDGVVRETKRKIKK